MPSLFPSLRGRARGEAFNKMNRDTALVVFSGGQDSTTCLFWAKREFKKVYALSFLYGQKHQKEVDLARAIARKAGVEFEVMDVSFIGRLGHNSLTDAGMEMDQEKPADSFPNTFVPGLTYVCFTEYDVTIPNKEVAFHKVSIENTFGEFLAAHNMKQARIAETEKYAHVTFFFNGGVEEPNEGEDRILVKSPKVATYDLKPEMSAYEVCDKLTSAIRSKEYDVIIINFANPDMVGHTGVEAAAIKAVEAVDECVGKAVDALKEVDGQMFICADHGNAEQLRDYETGEVFTAHTTNPVPFILVNADPTYGLREGGCLADIAPTLIELMGMEQPKEMTGKSLLIKK